jgi:hypothetical protein
VAIADPQTAVTTGETGGADRLANMPAFAATALNLLLEHLKR